MALTFSGVVSSMTKEISLEHVWVEFGEFTAVHKANLNIAGGEFFSFLGPSGCGKTTLLRCISGFQEPTRGKVRIGGEDMKGVGPNKRPTALILTLPSRWKCVALTRKPDASALMSCLN